MSKRPYQNVEYFKYAIMTSTNQNCIHGEICLKGTDQLLWRPATGLMVSGLIRGRAKFSSPQRPY
jgi:hypothetical protein